MQSPSDLARDSDAAPVAASNVPPRALGGPFVEELRYLLFGCAITAVLFGLLGWYNLSRLHEQLLGADRPHSFGDLMAGPFERALYVAFVTIPVVIYITRPRSRSRDGSPAPRVAAFVGTTMLLVFPAFFDDGPRLFAPPWFVRTLAGVGLIGFTAFGVYCLLYLRHNFSIIPEARDLVSGGPYRIVRHPLYFAEIGLATCLVLQNDLHAWSTLILVPFVGIQVIRSIYEERLLRTTFPAYDDYSRRVSRIVPIPR